ncbi:MAG: hypothetical protein RL514_1999 [Verrucomicrobiota bacterium]|jgi:RNA polymerase sigma-70 factor (ECF subfamily)
MPARALVVSVPVSSTAESELVARCRRGDARAWDELFERHYAAVGRYVFQLSPQFSREDADEIAQETFLSVIKHIGNFHGDCQLQTWLFRIAGNKARDHLEKVRAAKRGGGQQPLSLHAEDPETGLTLDAPSHLPGPDGALLHAERALLIGGALAQLGGPCQEIIELRYFADLSYEEISRALRLNEKTVSSRLSKCLDKLEEIARPIFAGGKAPVSPSNPPSSS